FLVALDTADFAFAATAATPRTESFSALAGVKRRRVRAGILICSPVAGLRPTRAASLRLRKMPKPASRIEPSFFSSRTTRVFNSSSARFASFLLIPMILAKCSITCDCVILNLQAHRANDRWPPITNPYRLNGAAANFKYRLALKAPDHQQHASAMGLAGALLWFPVYSYDL